MILLDVKMPKVTGLEVREVIRADPALSSTPVLMLPSSNQDADLSRAYSLGGPCCRGPANSS